MSDINMSMKFLDGKNTEVIDMLIKKNMKMRLTIETKLNPLDILVSKAL